MVAVTQHAGRLAEILEEAGVGASLRDAIEEPPPPGAVYLVPGSLQEGWALNPPSLPENGARFPTDSGGRGAPAANENGASGGDEGSVSLILLTDGELFGTVKERRYRRTGRSRQGPEVALADLVPGSYVVHVDHGVASFTGTTQMGPEDEEKGIPGVGVCRGR